MALLQFKKSVFAPPIVGYLGKQVVYFLSFLAYYQSHKMFVIKLLDYFAKISGVKTIGAAGAVHVGPGQQNKTGAPKLKMQKNFFRLF